MTPEIVTHIMRQLLWTACLLGGPVLLGGLVVGVVMGVVQAATQVQEASLNFVPKLAAVVLMLAFGGSWAMDKMVSFTGAMMQDMVLVAPHGRG